MTICFHRHYALYGERYDVIWPECGQDGCTRDDHHRRDLGERIVRCLHCQRHGEYVRYSGSASVKVFWLPRAVELRRLPR